MPLLSVIVPIYNSVFFIAQCAHALMHQTLSSDIEFLFLDDASTDNTLQVLDDVLSMYPRRRSQVRLFRNAEHQGVTAMRRLGIQQAQGLYLGWCDADDWCEPTMFESLLQKALSDKADIVTCDYYVHHPDGTMSVCNRCYDSSPRAYIQHIYRQPDTTLFLWNTLLRRDIFIQHQILPIEGIDIGEDMNMLVRFFIHSDRLSSLSVALYHHCESNGNSLTRRNSKASRYRFEQDVHNTESICGFLTSQDEAGFRLACQYYRFMTKWGYNQLFGYSREYFDLYRETHRDILLFSGIPFLLRLKMSVFFSSYLVYRFCTLLIRLFYR